MPIDIETRTIENGQPSMECNTCTTAGDDFEWPKSSERNIDMLTLLNEVFESADDIPALQATTG